MQAVARQEGQALLGDEKRAREVAAALAHPQARGPRKSPDLQFGAGQEDHSRWNAEVLVEQVEKLHHALLGYLGVAGCLYSQEREWVDVEETSEA